MPQVNIESEVNKIVVLDQSAITNLKRLYPGQGVGPSVCKQLLDRLESGSIAISQLPSEYSHLADFIGKE